MSPPGTPQKTMNNPIDYASPAQLSAEKALVKLGFSVSRVEFNEDYNPAAGAVIYMSRRKKGQMLLAQVDPDGSVSGESLSDYIAFVKANAR